LIHGDETKAVDKEYIQTVGTNTRILVRFSWCMCQVYSTLIFLLPSFGLKKLIRYFGS